jgi:histidyl-tRNA synthetase
MALSTQPYKGARDFYPADKRLQKYMFGKLRAVSERFGYEEYDASILEPLEIYLAKTGEEIVNEQTYSFEDRGGRKVAIRPEMTPTVSRLVAARRQELPYPMRLFNIGGRWRYERPQHGRYREFFQLDVDLFGIEGVAAEHEIIMVADDIMRSFGADRESYRIRINSRKLMDYMLHDYLQLDVTQSHAMSKLIDRREKIAPEEFSAQADAICGLVQRESGAVQKLLEVLDATSVAALPEALQSHDSVTELARLLTLLAESDVTNAVFDPNIMRGFDYYTGIVFEVFDNHPDNRRSMFGGGRYDGLVGLFGVDPVPTVGFAMGDATLQNFLETHNLLPELPPETDVYVALAGDVLQPAQAVITTLRAAGLKVAVDLSGRKLGDQFKVADKKGISWVVVIGERELQAQAYNLKNLHTGAEQAYDLEELVALLRQSEH